MTRADEIFETETCSRCGGCGEHSFTPEWGTTCFKCGSKKGVPGSGRVFTKRGAAALAKYRALTSRAVADLVPGDVVIDRGRFRVIEIRPGTTRWVVDGIEQPQGVDVVCEGITFAVPREARMQIAPRTQGERDAAIAEAVAYQASLTKTGKPRKGRG